MKWFILGLKNAFNYNGRARRKEYWMFILFNFIFGIFMMAFDNMMGLNFNLSADPNAIAAPYGPIYSFYSFIMLFPGLALTVRRLHDVNKSGWFIFIALVPLVGGIILLIKMCTEGTYGENQYGPNPKGENTLFNRNY